MAGFQIGEEEGPFRHTWPEVPIGHVIQAMNAGARKGYARLVFHLLVGDPRIALRSSPRCRLVDHGASGGGRTLSCSGAPAGLVPVLVRGGARDEFVEIAGSTAAWDREPFYNRRVQMAAIGEDRILLVEHRGGDLRLTLRPRPPLTWRVTDPLVDALDHMLVSMADHRHGGDVIALALGAIAALVAARRVWRRRLERMHLLPAGAMGVIAAILHASYGLARQGDLVVTAKAIVFSTPAAVGTGVLVACGAFVFLAARSWRGRLMGTLVATSVGWVGGAMTLGITTATNVAIASRTGIGGWIYEPSIHPFVLSALGCVACAFAYSIAGRIAARAHRGSR